MSEAASIAFDRMVSLVRSGALAPSTTPPDQAAFDRARRQREERLQLLDRLRAADIVVPKQSCIFELRAAAAAIGSLALNQHAAARPEAEKSK